jgi:DNA polymerase-3 subunit gamma/tau
VDPSRINDPEIAGEGERDRLKALAGRFSREDLLRAFDLLTRAEQEIKSAAQPRYHLEMALLRWIHLRKLVSIEDLIAAADGGSRGPAAQVQRPAPPAPRAAAPPTRPTPSGPAPSLAAQAARAAANVAATPAGSGLSRTLPEQAATRPAATSSVVSDVRRTVEPSANFKDVLIAEIKRVKAVFYNMVVAQAQKIEVAGDRVTFSFTPGQRALKDQFEQQKAWLESIAQPLAGRRITMVSALADGSVAPPADAAAGGKAPTQSAEKKTALREQALADAGVQTMLEVFPAEIRDVEEM